MIVAWKLQDLFRHLSQPWLKIPISSLIPSCLRIQQKPSKKHIRFKKYIYSTKPSFLPLTFSSQTNITLQLEHAILSNQKFEQDRKDKKKKLIKKKNTCCLSMYPAAREDQRINIVFFSRRTKWTNFLVLFLHPHD